MKTKNPLKSFSFRQAFWLVAIVSAVMFLPYLGLAEFTTKGEPREAVVAQSMLNTGNWILPVNNGCDLAYKPPFFHWCIAAFSLLFGEVSEAVSRLPSALALILLTLSGFVFYARRRSVEEAMLAAFLTLTAFEVHRAGLSCRVDMVLTACIVLALFALYRWLERDAAGLPWLAILSMSLATLTKGPVGIVLPCFVTFVFALLRGKRFWPLVGKFFLIALLSCVLPFLWYLMAYRQGGEAFLALVREENVDRFLGKMSYSSHENPAIYNFLTLIAGWLPWTLLALFGLFVAKWRKPYFHFSWKAFRERMLKVDAVQLFTWLSFLLILFFYCIPKSKRSVYLLPCYPFMAILLAQYFRKLVQGGRAPVRVFTAVIAVLIMLVTGAWLLLRTGWLPATLAGSRPENVAIVQVLSSAPISLADAFLVVLPFAAAAYSLYNIRKTLSHQLLNACLCIASLYAAFDGYYQPAVMNTRSVRPLVATIESHFANEALFGYIPADMMRFFTVNYYLGDKVSVFDAAEPKQGVVMVGERDRQQLFERYARSYRFVPVEHTRRRLTEVKQRIYFYRFQKL